MAWQRDLVQRGIVAGQAEMLGSTYAAGIVANGITQNTATPITAQINLVETVVLGVNDGVILPDVEKTFFDWIFIRNQDGVDVMNVWPASGQAINNPAVLNAPVGINPLTGKLFAKLITAAGVKVWVAL